MVSRSFVRAFQNIFRKSLDSSERNNFEDISSDVNFIRHIETSKSQQRKEEKAFGCNSYESYFSNVHPRNSIIKSHKNDKKNEVSLPNETQEENIIQKGETSGQCTHFKKELEKKEDKMESGKRKKTNSVPRESTSDESLSRDSLLSSGFSIVSDSQVPENICQSNSIRVTESDSKNGESSSESECSFNSSPKGIYDLCRGEQSKLCCKKKVELTRNEGKEKEEHEKKRMNAKIGVRTRASTRQEVSNSQKRKSIDEELGTVILNKKILSNKKKIVNENKTCKTVREDESVKKSDMLIRLRLPISGSNRKKLFALKLSKLICLVSNKRHPLNKWAGKLNVDNFNLLSDNEFNLLLKILSHFVCVKIVRR